MIKKITFLQWATIAKSDSSPVVSHSNSLADPYSALSPEFWVSFFWVVGLKVLGSACQAADFLLKQNITKHGIIWLIPRPEAVLMKQCRSVSDPTTSSSIFQKGMIRPGPLKPKLVDCYWLIKPGRSVLNKREGFCHTLMKGRQSLTLPLILKGLKQSCLYKYKDHACLFLCLSDALLGKLYNSLL